MAELPRNWTAIAAHFRRGGPMKHKNTSRGGAGLDPEIEEALREEEEKVGKIHRRKLKRRTDE